jgi:hypothetical protein
MLILKLTINPARPARYCGRIPGSRDLHYRSGRRNGLIDSAMLSFLRRPRAWMTRPEAAHPQTHEDWSRRPDTPIATFPTQPNLDQRPITGKREATMDSRAWQRSRATSVGRRPRRPRAPTPGRGPGASRRRVASGLALISRWAERCNSQVIGSDGVMRRLRGSGRPGLPGAGLGGRGGAPPRCR